jgi:hypothetical protein
VAAGEALASPLRDEADRKRQRLSPVPSLRGPGPLLLASPAVDLVEVFDDMFARVVWKGLCQQPSRELRW